MNAPHAAGVDQGTPSVQLLRWPADAGRRRELAATRTPRLLLVAIGERPPLIDDEEEDWVRTPSDERDLWARITRLQLRHDLRQSQPVLEDGVLRSGGIRVVLSPIGARIMEPLIDRLGRLVERGELSTSTGVTPRSLDAHVCRLRRQLGGTGLAIHTVRGRGFLLAKDHTALAAFAATIEEHPCPIS